MSPAKDDEAPAPMTNASLTTMGLLVRTAAVAPASVPPTSAVPNMSGAHAASICSGLSPQSLSTSCKIGADAASAGGLDYPELTLPMPLTMVHSNGLSSRTAFPFKTNRRGSRAARQSQSEASEAIAALLHASTRTPRRSSARRGRAQRIPDAADWLAGRRVLVDALRAGCANRRFAWSCGCCGSGSGVDGPEPAKIEM